MDMAIEDSKCPTCGRPATYTAPSTYCDLHWAVWWADGVASGADEWHEILIDVLKHYSDIKDLDVINEEIKTLCRDRWSHC